LFGLNVKDNDKWNYDIPTSIEDLFDRRIKEIIDKSDGKNPVAVGTDSITALPSITEMEEDLEAKSYGTTRAKILGIAFRKYLRSAAEKKVTLLFIDQVREKLGVVFGNKDTYSGGRAIKFYASTQVKVSIKETLKNKYKVPIGIVVKFKVEKNKVAPPYREGFFRLLFDYGIDDIGTNIEWLKEVNVIPYNRGKYDMSVLPEWKESSSKVSFDSAVKIIERDNLEKSLRDLVYKSWKEVYKTEKRKEKIRYEWFYENRI